MRNIPYIILLNAVNVLIYKIKSDDYYFVRKYNQIIDNIKYLSLVRNECLLACYNLNWRKHDCIRQLVSLTIHTTYNTTISFIILS